MILLICWAQPPVKTCTAAVSCSALIASQMSGSTACCDAASTIAASRHFVARAALHVLLMMIEPASLSTAKALGGGPVHAEPPSAAASC
eukprot:6213644-Pleurochrysis_carterae.AAC.2